MIRITERAIFIKQSGERLARGPEPGQIWQPSGVRSTSDKLAQAFRVREQLGISGLTLISGAGNIVRGETLRKKGIARHQADMLGRLATVMNTVVIAEALDELGIPSQILLSQGMTIEDRGFKPETYTPQRLLQAQAEGKLVLIAGGNGEDNATSDNAAVFYASDYRKVSDAEVAILKGTQVDGVFDANPNEVVNARRYKMIGAPQMLAEHERFAVVDMGSLRRLIEGNLPMLIFAEGGHDLENVLRHDMHNNDNGSSIGTLIVPEAIEPIFYPSVA